MATAALQLSKATTRPAAWDALVSRPPEELAGWRVWRRRKGAGYWLMRWATKLARRFDPEVTNPNGLEDCGTVKTVEECEDLCRIAYKEGGGKWAVTYEPVMVGRVHALKTQMRAKGDRRFDPFKVFDFSATEAVREQARHRLISVEEWEEVQATKAILSGAMKSEPRV
jgi:hypothetical protein